MKDEKTCDTDRKPQQPKSVLCWIRFEIDFFLRKAGEKENQEAENWFPLDPKPSRIEVHYDYDTGLY